MKAEVISIKKDKLNGKYDGYMFVYRGEPYQGRAKDPTERFVFGNQKEIVGPLLQLAVGDWVDLTFEKNGKFTNLVGIEKLSGPTVVAPRKEVAPAPSGGTYQRRDEGELQRRISRSAALKEGVQIALHQAKATTKPEVIVELAKEITRDLERFLNFEEEESEIAETVGTVKTDEDFDQIPF